MIGTSISASWFKQRSPRAVNSAASVKLCQWMFSSRHNSREAQDTSVNTPRDPWVWKKCKRGQLGYTIFTLITNNARWILGLLRMEITWFANWNYTDCWGIHAKMNLQSQWSSCQTLEQHHTAPHLWRRQQWLSKWRTRTGACGCSSACSGVSWGNTRNTISHTYGLNLKYVKPEWEIPCPLITPRPWN